MKERRISVGIVAIVVITLSITGYAQDERLIGGGVGITVFKDRDFRGSAATYTRDMPSLAAAGFDNSISSIRVGNGEYWEICESPNYRGRCVTVSGEERDLRTNNWDNLISSFRKVRGGGPTDPPPSKDYIVLFEQPNFRGNPQNYDSPTPNLNRRAQSVTIGRGKWQFCDGPNYSGRCIVLSNSVANLSSHGMARRVASVRPYQEPPGADWYVVLFTQANFRGNPTNYKTTQSRIVKSTGSVTIGKGVWELCTGNNFTGTCKTLTESSPNMRIFGIVNRTIRSLRPILPQPR